MTRLQHLAVAIMLGAPADASAQVRPRAPLPHHQPAFTIRLYGEAGVDRFAAGRTFNAIFGQDSGPVYGAGAEVVVRSNWFFRVAAWRFRQVGERAVRLENQTYRLGIPLTVTVLPVEVSGGYRFPIGSRKRFIPYVGVGVSSNSYTETSPFAEGDENVKDRFTGYHVLGGAEYRLHTLIGVAGEVQYSTVPGALGAGGMSAAFDETDLGGLIVRARVLFGR